ncbi:MAG: zinc-ribbon domain-containing protein [Clostridia bacterium]|nr:zinc-ribbon domain-containing protein [Clostridia bacterium]
MFCSKCGHINTDGTLFCQQCGSKLSKNKKNCTAYMG